MLAFPDQDPRLAAVRARDPAADGTFCYSVATTGIYCHPSCAARPALRENIAFHATPADAELAGFRPCRRCRPDLPPRAHRDAAIVQAACRTIEAAEEPPPLGALAGQAKLSPAHFHRLFRRVTGITPRAYAASRRQARVQDALSGGATVTQALYGAGFNSTGRFYEAAGPMLGMVPSHYRAGGGDETIRHACGRSTLGTVLVAATDRGVCAILLGDDAGVLLAKLRARFPRAALATAEEPAFSRQVSRVVALVDDPGGARAPGLALDIRGTVFQRRVWEALSRIPPGQTRSYGEVATVLGMPGGARAVATACAANPLAVAVPCHRVVAGDGALAGYRWGLDRKRRLLERERS